ncbi:hypothetical protein CEXT_611431 [Caerostris extrusa]|uniref:Uncharacterized protein n=1 Tax=Caerostris extrusa TaxID=172846 RepID=A0AAV4N4X1_CAEEX|nr:hypothetical protein CEXT_611431 [Caerostris extrusa]
MAILMPLFKIKLRQPTLMRRERQHAFSRATSKLATQIIPKLCWLSTLITFARRCAPRTFSEIRLTHTSRHVLKFFSFYCRLRMLVGDTALSAT